MQRTQIYFPEPLHQDAKIAAAMLKMNLSEYIRFVLKESMYGKKMTKKTSKKKKTDLTLLAKKSINLGKPDLAANFGKYFEASLR